MTGNFRGVSEFRGASSLTTLTQSWALNLIMKYVYFLNFRALAKNCAASFNDKEGAVANNWKEGKAVRVVC